ncbi:LysR family transcriptional regulator [Cobetia sp. UIB-001]|uniref:LysR family transcriptional regulator n=1 Tax=Cobetia sp. UIB-001 TaxID=2717697 RepID=UPI00384F1A9A
MDLLNAFRIYRQVAHEQSFTRAAERLNLVPSAVSRQISELEKWLGVRLINRTTRALHLTHEGHRYLEKVEQIIAQVDDLSDMRNDSQQVRGRIRMTAPMMMGQYVLPELLASFRRQHPQVEISLNLINRKVDLIEEEVDLALRAGYLDDSSMVGRSVGELAFKTVASPDYLARCGTPLAPAALSEHDCLINPALSSARRWRYQVDGKPTLIKVNGSLEANESLCLRDFALQGLGIALLPALYVTRGLEQGELVEVLADFAMPPLPIHLLHPSQRLIRPAVRALADHLVEALRQQPIDQLAI